MKPVVKLFLIVLIGQLVFYSAIFYSFESISTTGYPTKSKVIILPLIIGTFFSTWMITAFKKRVRKKGARNLNFRNYLNLAESVFEPACTPDSLISLIKDDELLKRYRIEHEGNEIKLYIRYSIFFTEMVHVDFDTNVIRIIAKPRFLAIYAPFGGSIQKLGYLECVLEEKHFTLA
jgi:hypothetical protein